MTEQAPAPTSLRQRRQQQTRADLVAAVLAVIGEDGVAGATIDQVSAASGISRGTVYAYFPGGRDELLRAAYAQLGHDLVARTRAALSVESGWEGQLSALAQAMFELASDERVGHFYNVSGPALISVGDERGIGSGASVEMIRDAFELAAARGDVESDIDAEVIALLLVGALREAATEVAAGALDPDRAVRAFARLARGLAGARAA
ncbi:TetR/AcrR family transcriptional regulator [Leucobacter salsicius]|uniref:TetR/AcrR family transcriptional regulator n=1 Tax=Leucobacter salsicius TaxID=664638 RepID=UPI000345719C|nr:TetR/AcrR family transcriptional regulator [Leucobacter salsicius]